MNEDEPIYLPPNHFIFSPDDFKPIYIKAPKLNFTYVPKSFSQKLLDLVSDAMLLSIFPSLLFGFYCLMSKIIL